MTDILLNGNIPVWVLIIFILLGAFGTFYERISPGLGRFLKIKREEKESQENEKKLLRMKVRRLEKSNAALATAMVFMLDKYIKDHPENHTVIDSMKHLIKVNLISEEDKNEQIEN